MRKRDEAAILLGLFLLGGAIGFKSPNGVPTRGVIPTDAGFSNTTVGSDSSPVAPNNSNDVANDASGATTKSSPPVDPYSGGNTGDKSNSQNIHPSLVATDNPGVAFAQKQVQVISTTPPTATKGGLSLIPNLPTVGGTGKESVTTAIYNPNTGQYQSYTNNELLFGNAPSGKNPQAVPAPSQPTHKIADPQSVDPIGTYYSTPNSPVITIPVTPSSAIPTLTQKTANPIDLLAYAQSQIPQVMTQKNQTPQPAQSYPDTTVPNPLTKQQPSILDGLTNFGQASLNALLAQGKNLTGLFSGIKIPQLFGVPAAPISSPTVIDPLVV
jgi:hypothetical protein